MIKDYGAYMLTKSLGDIDALSRAESDSEAARRESDKGRRQQAEQVIRQKRAKLCRDLPHVALHYLEIAQVAAPEGLRSQWEEMVLREPGACWEKVQEWRLAPFAALFAKPMIRTAELPPLSFWISFRFRPAKPFISSDEEQFYIVDNPIRKDKVFRLPYVAASSYKGALRSAARYVLGQGENDFDKPEIENLFGTDKRRRTKDLHAGRLCCFPTFFDKVGLEIINPRKRDTGAGTVPIPFETALGEGDFNLLYFPFDLSRTAFTVVAQDIELVAKAVHAMFRIYGLAAKKTSGFGISLNRTKTFLWLVHHWARITTNGRTEYHLLEIRQPEMKLTDLEPVARERLADVLRQEADV